MRAVGRDQVVVVAHRARRADDRRLLADREVQEAADLGLGVHLARALLEAADEHHRLQPLAGDVGLGKGVSAIACRTLAQGRRGSVVGSDRGAARLAPAPRGDASVRTGFDAGVRPVAASRRRRLGDQATRIERRQRSKNSRASIARGRRAASRDALGVARQQVPEQDDLALVDRRRSRRGRRARAPASTAGRAAAAAHDEAVARPWPASRRRRPTSLAVADTAGTSRTPSGDARAAVAALERARARRAARRALSTAAGCISHAAAAITTLSGSPSDAPAREGLAEGRQREGDRAADLLGVGRGAHREARCRTGTGRASAAAAGPARRRGARSAPARCRAPRRSGTPPSSRRRAARGASTGTHSTPGWSLQRALGGEVRRRASRGRRRRPARRSAVDEPAVGGARGLHDRLATASGGRG